MQAPVQTLDQAPRHAPGRAALWAAEGRALIRLAAPLVLTQLAQMAILATDIVMLGRLSRTALAAAAIGNTVYYFAWLVGSGPPAAIAPMIAHIAGEAAFDRAKVRATVRMGLWACIMLTLPLTVLLWSARPILLALHQEPQLAAGAGQFVSMLSFGLFFALGFQVLRNFATALGHPRATLWVMGISIGYNALADYALIFGHFGLPALGLRGSGIATASSAVFAFLALAVVISVNPALRAYRIFRRFLRPAWARLTEAFRLGMPIGMTMIFEAMLFNAMTLVMGAFGAIPVAAHQIALNFASVTFMVPLGVAMAATVRVGHAAGRGDAHGVRRAGFVALSVGAGFMMLCGLLMIVAGRQIAGLYLGGRTADDLKVLGLAALYLKVAAAFQVFDALQVVGAMSLRGLKDARTPMLLAGAAYWLVGAPICVVLGVWLHMQGLGVWIGLAAGLAAAATAMVARFNWLTRTA
ncbi:MATE family efflux transporter [Phenylobacterium montanum]|uniref:Multidrug-efflux transporter n=1 Tax=Phenylobacterium montanum TaxID=2823693 RepID=A0A975FZT6_9CAUL|nr:MATE family efflux transporter [Caulobacter sp. S6]QUD87852.1 MATE family efflux transporter [Caulobacter sp. S6]